MLFSDVEALNKRIAKLDEEIIAHEETLKRKKIKNGTLSGKRET